MNVISQRRFYLRTWKSNLKRDKLVLSIVLNSIEFSVFFVTFSNSFQHCFNWYISYIVQVRPVPHLVLQGAVLALCLLADDDEVQVVVASVVARQAAHVNHVSKQVQFTSVEIEM